ncbi:hypothetical protein Tco_1335552 [Tanacetum coccineum]
MSSSSTTSCLRVIEAAGTIGMKVRDSLTGIVVGKKVHLENTNLELDPINVAVKNHIVDLNGAAREEPATNAIVSCSINKDNVAKVHEGIENETPALNSFASMLKDKNLKKLVKLTKLTSDEIVSGAHVAIPLVTIKEVSSWLGVVDGLDGTERGYQGRCLNVPLLGELEVVADEPMVGPLVDEIAEPIVEAEEQVIAPVVDMDEDIAMLFGDDDFGDDDSEGFDKEVVWEVNEEWMMAPITPPLMPAVPASSVYEVSDDEVAAGITIGEIVPGISAVEGQVQVMASYKKVYVRR